MRERTECLSDQSAKLGAPQVRYPTRAVFRQAYIHAQALPWLAGLAEKMLLDTFTSHSVKGNIFFCVLTAFLWLGYRLLAVAFNVAIQDLASALTHRREGRTVHGHT